MSRPPTRFLAGLLLVALAGCASAPAAPQTESDPFSELGGQATATTGLIRGVVVDQAVFPLPGVSITIAGTDHATTTNADGAFVVDALEPGFYTVRASKSAYLPAQQQVEVVAGVGQPPVLKMQLIPDTNATPYVVPFQWRGFMQCSTSAVQVCGAPNTAIQTFCQGGVPPFCDLPQEVTGDDFLEHFPVVKPPTWTQAELTWSSTQALADSMTVIMEAFYIDGLSFQGLDSASGRSPVLVQADAAAIDATQLGQDGSSFGGLVPLQLRVFSGPSETAGGAVGAVVEQDFEAFVHVFYGYSPPEDWRFTQQPDVPLPP